MTSLRSQILKETTEERVAKTIAHFEEQKDVSKGGNHGNTSSHKQLNNSGYFAQENVKEYQREMLTHLFSGEKKKKKGRGGFFETREELDEWLQEFFNLCISKEVVPTISALSTFLMCSRDVIYSHANNPSSPFFESCRNAIEYCHACLESGASESKLNSVAYIFQAKNYFNMKDVQEVKVAPNQGQISNSEETLNALKDQIQKQEPHKQIDMREAVYTEK